MKITLLTTNSCSNCEKVKQNVKDILHELQQSIDFELDERDLMDNPELANRHDLTISPGIIIDGELVSQGVPDKQSLRKTIEEHSDED